MFRFRNIKPEDAPVPIAVITGDLHLTQDERDELAGAIRCGDVRKIRALIIRSGVRMERGEAMLAEAGWVP